MTDAAILPLVEEHDPVRRHRGKPKGRQQGSGSNRVAAVLSQRHGNRSRSRSNAAHRRSGSAFFSHDVPAAAVLTPHGGSSTTRQQQQQSRRGSRSRSRGISPQRRSGSAFFSPDVTRIRRETSSPQSRQYVHMNLTIALHVVLLDADVIDVVPQLTDVKAHIIVVLFEKEDGYIRGGSQKSKYFPSGEW